MSTGKNERPYSAIFSSTVTFPIGSCKTRNNSLVRKKREHKTQLPTVLKLLNKDVKFPSDSLFCSQTDPFVNFTGEGEQFQETAWVDHFRSQSTVINDLDFAVLYEIKTIGKNSVGTSPDSNITEAFVAGNPAVGKPLKTSFIASLNRRSQHFGDIRMTICRLVMLQIFNQIKFETWITDHARVYAR